MKISMKLPVTIAIFMQILTANNALEFDGINDHVRLSETLSVGSSSNTVEMWVKVPEVGSANLEAGERVGIMLGNYDDGENAGWEIHAAGEIRIWWNGNPEEKGTRDLRDNSWHHVAFVRDKTNDKILAYVDGELEFEVSSCGADLTFTWEHYIGGDRRGSGVPYFHGEIDELRVWNTARTQTQIREYMCADVSDQSGLVAYYRMTDGSGTTLSDNAGTNTGTLHNMDNSDWVRDNQVPEGDGSTMPYRINGLNQLYWVSANSSSWSSDFEQIADIDASATVAWNTGAGFSPIGTHASNFLGSYDGAGYTITGLTVNRSSENYTGFIGRLDGGPVSDLGMIDISMTGAGSTGGVVGYVESGNVSNCYVTGSVSGTDYAGGLVGQIANGTISQSYSTASVAGSGDHVGGLNGYLGSSIQNCYARGSVNGNTNVGGLVGSAVGGSTINDSYSTSAVVGSSNAGGLVGYAAEEESTMPGEESMPGATVTASFWDTETSGMTESSAGTGKSTVEMKSSGTFTDAGWDFKGESVNGSENIWNIGNDRNDGYPYLNFQHPTDTPLPVTLAFFSAELEQGAVNVTWVTESETENAYFLLYRNGKTVVKIPGAGTTSEPQSYAWTDQYVIPGRTYTYILADVDLQGKETKHHEVEVEAKVEAENGVDIDHTIGSAYPNPFNPVTMVPLNLAKEANVYAQLYDMLGRPVRELHNGTLSAGSYDLKIDGAKLSTGIYFVHVRVKDVTHVQKIALMK